MKPISSRSNKKKSNKAVNSDLPEECHKDGAWRLLINQLFRYIGTTGEVFNVSDKTMIRAVEVLWDEVYGTTGIEMEITTTSIPVRLVSV